MTGPLDMATLAAIRSRDDERTLTYGSGWGSAAVVDRRALLAEVDRLAAALAAAERERDEAGQSSLNRLAQNIDLRTALTAERAKVAQFDVERACEVMHDAYEAAAVGAGWETQQASRKPWAEVPEANKATMRAAVIALLAALADGAAGQPLSPDVRCDR